MSVKVVRQDQPRLLRRSSPASQRCSSCGRGFRDRDYRTGREVSRCVCGAKRPEETVEDHGYTTRIGLAMRSEPEAIPAEVQEEYSKRARERELAKLEELRQDGLAAVTQIEALPAATYRTKKQARAARKRLEAALHPTETAI